MSCPTTCASTGPDCASRCSRGRTSRQRSESSSFRRATERGGSLASRRCSTDSSSSLAASLAEADCRAEHPPGLCGASELSAGLEAILPPRRHTGHLRRPGSVDSAPTPSHPPQTVETRHDHLPRAAGSGPTPARSRVGGTQRSPLVEALGQAHSSGLPHPLLRRPRRAEAGRVTSTLRTARCGPACRVVWQGSRGITSGPYADFGMGAGGQLWGCRPCPARGAVVVCRSETL
jgi:hypothetical protein